MAPTHSTPRMMRQHRSRSCWSMLLLSVTVAFLLLYFMWVVKGFKLNPVQAATAGAVEPTKKQVVLGISPTDSKETADRLNQSSTLNIRSSKDHPDADSSDRTTETSSTMDVQRATVPDTSPQSAATASVTALLASPVVQDRHFKQEVTSTPEDFTAGALGRSSGSQLTHPILGGTLFTFGLLSPRLARSGGDNSIPEIALPNLVVSSLAASRHSAIATMDGHVWTMGHNDSKGGGGHGSKPLEHSGQLGRGGGMKPDRVDALQGLFVVQVVTGRYHSLAITASGEVYSWGLNDWGQLGRAGVGAAGPEDPTECFSGASCHDGQPRKVMQLEGTRIVGGTSGRYNVMVLDSTGVLHVWGYDGCASGVLPEQAEAWRARRVLGAMERTKVVAFDAGYTFWIAATDAGAVFTCNHQEGLGTLQWADDGYAGTLGSKRKHNDAGELGREGNPLVPLQVLGELEGKVVKAVAAGREHGLAVTSEGRVYGWGGRREIAGRPGGILKLPGLLGGALANDTILLVAGGEYFSIAASRHKVYGWGGNDYLSVGVGRNNPVQKPKPGRDRGTVTEPADVAGELSDGSWSILEIAAGFQHSMVIAQRAGAGGAGAAKERTLVSGAGPAVEVAAAGIQPADKESLAATTATVAPGIASSAILAAVTPGADATTSPGASGSSGSSSNSAAVVTGAADMIRSSSAYAYGQVAKQPTGGGQSVAQVWSTFQTSPKHAAIVDASPDVFKALPQSFSADFKNPCWLQDGKLRCIPYYHILGVSKCGTTDIYNRLIKHPNVYESMNKGPHWWDECSWPLQGACTAPPNGDFEGYIDLFKKAAAGIEKDPLGVTGEASSNTFTSSRGVYLRGPTMTREDLNVTLPELMKEASPFLRLIVIFRNPVDRYHSAFYYYRWWKKDEPAPSAEDFHASTVKEIGEWDACVNERGLAKCVRLYNPQQLVKGMYSEFLGEWMEAFPRHQLLFLRNEDYKVAQRAHMDAVFAFLGARNLTEPEWAKVMDMPVKNVGKGKSDMLPETRQLLQGFYAPFNMALAKQLADERYLWK